jgi:hypothetical protein
MNPLVSDNPWTTHAGVSEANVCTAHHNDVAYVEQNLAMPNLQVGTSAKWQGASKLLRTQRPMCYEMHTNM